MGTNGTVEPEDTPADAVAADITCRCFCEMGLGFREGEQEQLSADKRNAFTRVSAIGQDTGEQTIGKTKIERNQIYYGGIQWRKRAARTTSSVRICV